MVASPAYLKRQGTPKHLADLERHECIQFDLPSSGRALGWLLNAAGDEREIFLAGNYTCADDVLGGVTLAESGAGLFQSYRFVVEKELDDGTLVEVLQNFAGRSRPFSLLYPHGRLLPSRVRAFVDFLMEQTQRCSVRKRERQRDRKPGGARDEWNCRRDGLNQSVDQVA